MKLPTSYSFKLKKLHAFSILEVVIAMAIVATISLISTRLIQSGLDTKNMAELKLASIKKMNVFSTIMRKDLENALNVKLKSFQGLDLNASFLLDGAIHKMTWVTLRESNAYTGSPVRRMVYLFKDNKLLRRQYFAEHPAEDVYIESILLENITEWRAELYFENTWYNNWPLTTIQQTMLPKAVKLNFIHNHFRYEFLISVGLLDV